MTNTQKGMGGQGNTATEINIVSQNSTTLISKVRQNLEEAMTDMAQFVKYLYMKNMQQSKSIVVMDEVTRQNLVQTITPEDMSVDSNTYVKADSTMIMNKTVMLKLLGDAVRVFNPVLNMPNVAQRYFELTGLSGVQDLVKTEPPAPPPMPPPPPPEPEHKPSDTLTYKDAPDDVKREIEAQAGLKPSQM